MRVGTAGWGLPRPWRDDFPAGGEQPRRDTPAGSRRRRSTAPSTGRTAERVRALGAAVPADFRFAVKLPRAITHDQRLVAADVLLEVFLDEVRGLGDRLGPLLVQLPPSLASTRRAPTSSRARCAGSSTGRWPASRATRPGSARRATRCCAGIAWRAWGPTRRSHPARAHQAGGRGSPTCGCTGRRDRTTRTTTQPPCGATQRSCVRAREAAAMLVHLRQHHARRRDGQCADARRDAGRRAGGDAGLTTPEPLVRRCRRSALPSSRPPVVRLHRQSAERHHPLQRAAARDGGLLEVAADHAERLVHERRAARVGEAAANGALHLLAQDLALARERLDRPSEPRPLRARGGRRRSAGCRPSRARSDEGAPADSSSVTSAAATSASRHPA